jgi:small subunit ribosomal protein S17
MPTAKSTSKTTAAKPAVKKDAPKKSLENVKGTRVGVVESDKRHQTRKVVVNYMSQHPKYGKYIRQRTVLQVHDDANTSKMGDIVEVAPCRPISKSKTWTLVRVVEQRSAQAAALASAKELRQ